MATVVTDRFLEGYFAEPDARCPYIATSISSDAFEIGRAFMKAGNLPADYVRKSRGDSYVVKAGGETIVCSVKWRKGVPEVREISA